MGGRLKKEETYVYLWLIDVDVWQTPTKFCKAIILQLKKKKKEILARMIPEAAVVTLSEVVTLAVEHVRSKGVPQEQVKRAGGGEPSGEAQR